ncbi:hypothetical protein D3C85_1239280 [compost metagenome]
MIEPAGLFFRQQVSQGLQGFTQAHVVAEDAAHFQFAKGLHPVQPFQLIRSQGRFQPFGRRDVSMVRLTQALGKTAQALTALPHQWYAFQRAQARGIRQTQTQGVTHMVTQVQRAQGGHQRFDPTIGQRDFALGLGTETPVAKSDQQQFIIVALGQACGVHQLWLAAQQMQEDG